MLEWDADPSPGDIILAASKNPKWAFYATLQLLTGAPSIYTHAALCLDNGEYLDHRPGGAIVRPLEDLQERSAVAFSRLPLTDAQRESLVASARRYVGAPYTFWRFGYLAGQTFRAPLRAMTAIDQKLCKGASICSELVLRVYADAQVSYYGYETDPRIVSPGTLSRVGPWTHYMALPTLVLPEIAT